MVEGRRARLLDGSMVSTGPAGRILGLCWVLWCRLPGNQCSGGTARDCMDTCQPPVEESNRLGPIRGLDSTGAESAATQLLGNRRLGSGAVDAEYTGWPRISVKGS
ncbi:hypothetical protein NDU88_002089 [Pleurodeles waltl]|uniref:Uncharacterized protein n=1 Tax=Pleurodeles waltl TaxID=8319 RepID=A0AAV7MPI3_PLEWA|nr:hypothetical protein NDU88_002089 [Pleurodeles waltl]